VTCCTWGTSLLLLTFSRTSSQLTPYVHLLVMAPLIYLPLVLMLYRQEPLVRYGLTFARTGRALGLTILTIVIVFPLYTLGFHTYRQGLLSFNSLRVGVSPFAWVNWPLNVPHAWSWVLNAFVWELFFVALPEEFFYRGYLQGRLNARFSGRWRLLGAAVGVALPASAALFALHHVLISAAPQGLLVFFPGLLFGWLREASGSLPAPVLFHTACNLFARLLAQASSL
jgi:uncharacterized protein